MLEADHKASTKAFWERIVLGMLEKRQGEQSGCCTLGDQKRGRKWAGQWGINRNQSKWRIGRHRKHLDFTICVEETIRQRLEIRTVTWPDELFSVKNDGRGRDSSDNEKSRGAGGGDITIHQLLRPKIWESFCISLFLLFPTSNSLENLFGFLLKIHIDSYHLHHHHPCPSHHHLFPGPPPEFPNWSLCLKPRLPRLFSTQWPRQSSKSLHWNRASRTSNSQGFLNARSIKVNHSTMILMIWLPPTPWAPFFPFSPLHTPF